MNDTQINYRETYEEINNIKLPDNAIIILTIDGDLRYLSDEKEILLWKQYKKMNWI